ncbi:MAG TPA: hypothetical protein VKW08_01450 [Xanthobacteraceae bacterium]|nr:hypothetical protein [Xanthobacteraceae bacterium]
MAKERVLEGDRSAEEHKENLQERRQRQEESLESGLEGTFPGSDAINVVQPPPSILDRKGKAKGTPGRD